MTKKPHRPPTLAEMQKAIDTFNAAVVIGDAVRVINDDGTVSDDATTSDAQILSGHTPVVMLKNKGMFLLERVRAVKA